MDVLRFNGATLPHPSLYFSFLARHSDRGAVKNLAHLHRASQVVSLLQRVALPRVEGRIMSTYYLPICLKKTRFFARSDFGYNPHKQEQMSKTIHVDPLDPQICWHSIDFFPGLIFKLAFSEACRRSKGLKGILRHKASPFDPTKTTVHCLGQFFGIHLASGQQQHHLARSIFVCKEKEWNWHQIPRFPHTYVSSSVYFP